MRKALDVREARFELLEDLECPFLLVFGAETLGHRHRAAERASDITDRLHCEHGGLSLFHCLSPLDTIRACASEFGKDRSSCLGDWR
jgi:hypothetical protein